MVISGIVDTSIIVDYLRQYEIAKNWFASQRLNYLAITPIVWLETIQGASNKMELERAVRFLKRFSMEHPTPDDNDWAMDQLARYWLSHNIQFADVMIASVAVRQSVPLYTRNIKHYAPLPDVDEQKPY